MDFAVLSSLISNGGSFWLFQFVFVILAAGMTLLLTRFLFKLKASRKPCRILYYYGEKSLLEALQRSHPKLTHLPDAIMGLDGRLWRLRSLMDLEAAAESESMKYRVIGIGFYKDPLKKRYISTSCDLPKMPV
jgi:hypothetical protein